MDREILFRAVSQLDGNWVYGSLIKYDYERPNMKDLSKPHIESSYDICRKESDWCFSYKNVPVFEETIGQYTEITDKNGTKIFEGDIVKVLGMIGKVISQCGSFGICFDDCVDYEKLDKFTQKRIGNNFSGVCCDNFISLYEIWWNLNNLDDYLYEVEVIGNIYDNPEMVEGL